MFRTKIVQSFLFSEPRRGSTKQMDDIVHIDDVKSLVKELQARRREWGTENHAAKMYAVTNEDSIKMHINMYLAHMAQFYFKESDPWALVLDASDMGTSLVFDIFGIHNIVVPNYYKKSTDFETMRRRMPNVMSLPVSVENYIDAWAVTTNDDDYASTIRYTASTYKFCLLYTSPSPRD